MDSKIFNELKNKGVVTNPFITCDDVKDFKELMEKGYASGIGAQEVYATLIANCKENVQPVKEEVKESSVKKESAKKEVKEETVVEETVKEEEIIVDEGETVVEEPKVETKAKSSKK